MDCSQIKLVSEEKILAEYINDLIKSKPLIVKALQLCEDYCKEYIKSREDLAYIASYRRKIRFSRNFIQEVLDKSNKEDYL